jgi:NAD(P)-dependent dehydrogenase (short-subunit alcohol dehydrogenase family)
MAGRFEGRGILVFGAGSSGPGWGNGKAAATLYAREGAHVVAVDRDLQAARATCELIRAEGHACEAIAADVTRGTEVEAAVAQAQALCGRIDVLHLNVGATEIGDPVELSEEAWHRGIDVNLTGAFLACKHTLPVMLAQGKGAIVAISSLASVQVNQYPYVAYASAKAGLNQFIRALAVRYASRGIRANAVLPGVMDTPMVYSQLAGQFEDVEAMRRRRHAASPMGVMGDAWDVAHAAAFLASDEAKYITGVCLPVDGGKSCAGR